MNNPIFVTCAKLGEKSSTALFHDPDVTLSSNIQRALAYAESKARAGFLCNTRVVYLGTERRRFNRDWIHIKRVMY